MTSQFANHPDPMRAPQYYASVPTKRLLAWAIDMVITAIMALIIVPFTAFIGVFFFPVLFMFVGFAYRCLTIGSGSATWGMRIMAIELRDANGERFDFGLAVMHTLGYSLSLAIFIVQLVSIVLMLGSARGQSLTDMAMGSVMINRR